METGRETDTEPGGERERGPKTEMGMERQTDRQRR